MLITLLDEKGGAYLFNENLKEVNIYFKIKGSVCDI